MESVFISYSRGDRNSINVILQELSNASIPVWLDETNILPSMDFNDKIIDGLESSQFLLIVMTQRSAESEYVKDELHWALRNRSGRIVPVMLEKCDPARFHLRMMRLQYVDLTPTNKSGLDDLR